MSGTLLHKIAEFVIFDSEASVKKSGLRKRTAIQISLKTSQRANHTLYKNFVSHTAKYGNMPVLDFS